MFSALNFRSVVVGSVAVASYRNYLNRNGVTYRMPMGGGPRGSDRDPSNEPSSERTSGLLCLIITLCFMLFVLLMIPSLIEPPVLYIGVVFSLLTLIFIIGFTHSYLKSKTRFSNRSNSNVEVDRRLSNESNNLTNLIQCEEQHNNNGSQLSVSSSDLPPKYELPPSYSQTIYSINI